MIENLSRPLRWLVPLAVIALAGMGRSGLPQGEGSPRASLGIRIACDCTVSARPSAERPWVFRSPITVTMVQRGGPADGILRADDLITHVRGAALTSAAGAKQLADVRPGERVALRIRRDAREMEVVVTAASAPPDDPHVIGARAPQVVVPTPLAAASPRQPATQAATQAAAVPRPADLESEGWLGFALACVNCGWAREAGDAAPYWESTAPPRIHAVQPGSPAAIAGLEVGDILTRVNGIAITERAAGRALGGVRPGRMLRLSVERNGAEREVRATAIAIPSGVTAGDARVAGRIGGVEVTLAGVGDAVVSVDTLRGEMTIRIAGKIVTLRDTRSRAPLPPRP